MRSIFCLVSSTASSFCGEVAQRRTRQNGKIGTNSCHHQNDVTSLRQRDHCASAVACIGAPFSVARVSPRQSEMVRLLARMNLVSTLHARCFPVWPRIIPAQCPRRCSTFPTDE